MSLPRAEATPSDGPEVTVVIPAFNEVGAVAGTVREVDRVLREAGRRFEILVVDDGSSDGTGAAAAEAPCRVLRQPRNRGYGAALKRGVMEAKAPLVCITDADGTYPATAIPELLAATADHEMAVGARVTPNVAIPWERRPAKWFIAKLAGYLAGRDIPDLNSGLRVFRRRRARQFARILPDGFSFTTTITLAHLCNGLEVAYVPITYAKRVGESKIRPRHAYDFTLLILRAVVLFNPLKVFLPVGAAMFLFGAAKLVYDVFVGNLSESAVMGVLAAIIVWCVGLLADQNMRIGLDVTAWDEGE
ncbi:MAG TPA: glycosyltransferase family 2 protein [Planctomycetota bacterium]|nr:glycosyltransferase family 2 protein [Planctomycetota bacterium]